MAAPGTVPGSTARSLPAAAAPSTALVASTVGALLFAALTTALGAANGAPLEFLVLDLVIGGVYLAAGVVA